MAGAAVCRSLPCYRKLTNNGAATRTLAGAAKFGVPKRSAVNPRARTARRDTPHIGSPSPAHNARSEEVYEIANMDSALLIHRLHFAFTITFHYLFPQLTMGLAPLIVVLKTMALRTGNPIYNQSARFWARIFGINFLMGVVTGIPMEFQFGTNWSHFARLTGGVIGQPLVMEGVFAFFLESAFLGLFLYGEKRLSPRGHWWAAFLVFLGSWLSGYFIIVTDAWMQHPVAFQRAADGSFQVVSFWGLFLNPWALLQFAHNMSGAVITGAFVMAAVGAFYLLDGKFTEYGRIFLRIGVIAGVICSILQIFPTGDLQGRYLAKKQPVTTAAMEG